MGRHSRRGPAPRGDGAENPAPREGRSGAPGRRRANGPAAGGGTAAPADGTPAQGVPRVRGRGAPRPTDGTPAHGTPLPPDGTPARGVPRLPDGTPAHGSPRLPDGTPAHGVPRYADGGTPAQGAPQARGSHPEQREPGGGWGELRGRTTAGTGCATPAGPPPGALDRPGPPTAPGLPLPRQRRSRDLPGGPRQEYLDAFGADDDDEDDVFAVRPPRPAPGGGAEPRPAADGASGDGTGDGGVVTVGEAPPGGGPAPGRGGRGRTFTGVAAAAVTTVLAVVVAGQVAEGPRSGPVGAPAVGDQVRGGHDSASRTDTRPTPSRSPAPLTYEQKMNRTYPLAADLKGSMEFETVPGGDKAPGRGRKYTYRVDIERGLGLDGALFAQAVQKTLNDDRSWAHDGARTFERVQSGEPDFVITLASPGTTAAWCAKSGLDTSVDNVSCDSASTERVMINAYRWAQGSTTYGDRIHAYRQMLINHEVGHRIGHNHVSCDTDGQLAPVMQQQTKFLDHDGIRCRPNPWAYPTG
ncbi:DUF3152 domain-containing protein [Streptomyces sp. SID8352]|uniref:DUF3152 domain-containing protein n=1 Tax=Streptomyces sp. SID8352 TaxID=2690338 RepID=UPI0013720FAD|nr:DUF3152 domain-containing protein [Streptomyces sp. SID8352]